MEGWVCCCSTFNNKKRNWWRSCLKSDIVKLFLVVDFTIVHSSYVIQEYRDRPFLYLMQGFPRHEVVYLVSIEDLHLRHHITRTWCFSAMLAVKPYAVTVC